MNEPLTSSLSKLDDADLWHLQLYVAGKTPKSLAAFKNLTQLCEDRLEKRCKIEVIDLLKHPELAAQNQILAIPTLVRLLPEPIRKVIGDLSNTEKVLFGLDIHGTQDHSPRKEIPSELDDKFHEQGP